MNTKKTLMTLACGIAAIATAWGDTRPFRGIIEDAAIIERDAAAINLDLKPKTYDAAKVKADIETLGGHIASLRKDVDVIDQNAGNLSASQKTDWDLVKTKAQLLTVFYDQKASLTASDLAKNRSMIRALADGIAKRADMLQKTAAKLDR